MTGAVGIVFGIDETELEAELSPAILVAFKVTGYDMPFVSPVIVIVFPDTVVDV